MSPDCKPELKLMFKRGKENKHIFEGSRLSLPAELFLLTCTQHFRQGVVVLPHTSVPSMSLGEIISSQSGFTSTVSFEPCVTPGLGSNSTEEWHRDGNSSAPYG